MVLKAKVNNLVENDRRQRPSEILSYDETIEVGRCTRFVISSLSPKGVERSAQRNHYHSGPLSLSFDVVQNDERTNEQNEV